MARKINPGIYAIEHISTNKIYVGSSVTPSDRMVGHRRELRKGTHSNAHLQNSWNKHTENEFRFYIIEDNLSAELLESKENEYMIRYGIANEITGTFDETKGFNMSWAGREGFMDPSRRKTGKDHPNFGKSSWNKNKTLSADHRDKVSKNNGNQKTYILTGIDGKEITVTNLNRFCRDNGYKTVSLGHFKNGKLKKWYGYKSIVLKGDL